jgi:glycosyltransferase involved in cell wall biosynthesis
MDILHVIESLDPATGGPALVSISLAAAQARLGNKVSILCNNDPKRRPDIVKAHAIIPGADLVDIVDLASPGLAEKLLSIKALPLLRKLIHRGSFVHLHGVWEPTLWRAAAIAHERGAGYAVRPLSLLHPWQMKRFVVAKKIAFALGVQRMLDQASFIHALNEDEVIFVRKYAPKARIEVLPNGVFMEQFEPWPEKGSFYARHPELKGAPFILFLSRIHHQKGLKYLAAAFQEVTRKNLDVRLVVAGPDRGEAGVFRDLIAQMELTSRVHLVGPLYGAEKTEALCDAACYCLPSLNEGFSMALAEALACGLPVVISEQCFFPEVVRAGAGKIVPLDPLVIAGELSNILQNPTLRANMSEAARRLVSEHYTWPRIAEKSVAIYTRILQR